MLSLWSRVTLVHSVVTLRVVLIVGFHRGAVWSQYMVPNCVSSVVPLWGHCGATVVQCRQCGHNAAPPCAELLLSHYYRTTEGCETLRTVI